MLSDILLGGHWPMKKRPSDRKSAGKRPCSNWTPLPRCSTSNRSSWRRSKRKGNTKDVKQVSMGWELDFLGPSYIKKNYFFLSLSSVILSISPNCCNCMECFSRFSLFYYLFPVQFFSSFSELVVKEGPRPALRVWDWQFGGETTYVLACWHNWLACWHCNQHLLIGKCKKIWSQRSATSWQQSAQKRCNEFAPVACTTRNIWKRHSGSTKAKNRFSNGVGKADSDEINNKCDKVN